MSGKTKSCLLTGLVVVILSVPSAVLAQWNPIRQGLDAARRGVQPETRSPGREAPQGVADEKVGGPGLASATTFKNPKRPFSYTIPAGWRQESGNPTGKRVVFMKPGTTAAFQFHFTQMVPSFPRKASVDDSYKQALEEKTIGKYLSVKRRNQGDVMG